MATTLRDIAKACGKDISTVSRALRGDERVRQATRDEVAEVALRLGYVPNLSARSLAGARTRTIWYLIPSMNDPIQAKGVEEASAYLFEKGYEVSIILYQGEAQRYRHLLRRLSQGVTDGAVIVPGLANATTEELTALQDKDFPLIFFDRYPKETTVPTVTSDNAGGAAELARRLAEDGAERFVVLMSREGNSVEQARFEGATEYLGRAGLPFVIGDRFDPSFIEPGSCLGLISTSQHKVQCFIEEFLPEPPPLRFGVFDYWQGDPYPAISATVCKQDLPAMARQACDLILEMIDGSFPDEIMHPIPPQGFETITTQVK